MQIFPQNFNRAPQAALKTTGFWAQSREKSCSLVKSDLGNVLPGAEPSDALAAGAAPEDVLDVPLHGVRQDGLGGPIR